MDFGIARQAGAAALTATGAFVGTLTYAPPEAAGGVGGHRGDIYSSGVTLYHMIAGEPAATTD
jgi:serine/threonine-protein kinase